MYVAVGMFILMILLTISVYLFIRAFSRYGSIQEGFEGYSISNGLPFEKFNYWFRTAPLFEVGRPLPANPLPINVRLF